MTIRRRVNDSASGMDGRDHQNRQPTGGRRDLRFPNDHPDDQRRDDRHRDDQQRDDQQQGRQSQENTSSAESEPTVRASKATKPRPSRVGTRSVITLKPDQLARKREHDREAQRVLRQKTKDQIANQQEQIGILTQQLHDSHQRLRNAQSTARGLLDENARLRNRLAEVGFPEPRHPSDSSILRSLSSASESSMEGLASGPSQATVVPPLAMTPTPPGSRQDSWQQNVSAFAPAHSATPGSGPGPVQVSQGLTTWRSHDSTHSLQASPPQLQNLSQQGPAPPPQQQQHWTTPVGSQGFGFAGVPPRAQPYQTSPPAPPQFHSPAYPSAAPPPQAEFQALNVSNSPGYPSPSASQSYVQAAAAARYSLGHMGLAGDPNTGAGGYVSAAAQYQQQHQQQPQQHQQQQQQQQHAQLPPPPSLQSGAGPQYIPRQQPLGSAYQHPHYPNTSGPEDGRHY